MRIALRTAALAASIVACAGEPAPEPEDTAEPAEAVAPASAPLATTYAPELNVNLDGMEETESGLRYEVLKAGTGAVVQPGQTAVVHYTGWLPDGTKFDSSRDRGEPLAFPVGAGRVIQGWDEGVAGMAIGEERKLVIPPALGYGPAGAGDVIPPNSTLVFDVELIEIES